MIIKDVIAILENWAPIAYAEDFDNVGLLVGSIDTSVTNILVTHDALEVTIQEAIDKDCNLIVCFHPIIFSGLKRITGTSYVERVVIKAIQNNIAIYAMHTALDNVAHGVNHGMCTALKLKDTQILIPKKQHIFKLTTYVPSDKADMLKQALFNAGAGQIGQYDSCSFITKGKGSFRPLETANPTLGKKGELHVEDEIQLHLTFEKHLEKQLLKALFETHPYEEVAYEITALNNVHQYVGMGMVGELTESLSEKEFLDLVKNTFSCGGIRHSKFLDKPISKVAVLGGSGAFAIDSAKKIGAQAFITADLKYHDYYKAEDDILIADIGHFESERFTKNLITDYLKKKIANFAVILSVEDTNPIHYI